MLELTEQWKREDMIFFVTSPFKNKHSLFWFPKIIPKIVLVITICIYAILPHKYQIG